MMHMVEINKNGYIYIYMIFMLSIKEKEYRMISIYGTYKL